MNMIAKEVREQAVAHAISAYPHESVGVVVDGAYIPLENKHESPARDFYVPPEEYLALGTIEALLHSHPFVKGDVIPCLYPSARDMASQMAMAVPWGIICCDDERAWEIEWFGDQTPRKPLEGRGFAHGITDCYSLIRDYYLMEHGIRLKEFPRDWEWWKNGQDLYVEGFSQTGFVSIAPSGLLPGDVFLASIGTSAMRGGKVNHGGIYLGNDMILHHKTGASPYDPGRLSVRECGIRYMQYATHYLRHEEMPCR